MEVKKRFLSLILALCMLMSLVPMNVFATEADGNDTSEATTETTSPVASEAEASGGEGLGMTYVPAPFDTSADAQYRVLHIDAARKYLDLETLELIVGHAANNGMNQINLYLSDNQGLRFAPVNDAKDFVVEANGTTYDLSGILGSYDYTVETTKKTDNNPGWITADQMKTLIDYAAGKGVVIVPSINMPCHMATILQYFRADNAETADVNEKFCKTFTTKNGTWLSQDSLDTSNPDAVNFALALLEMYCAYFESVGIKYYCIAADEYGQDMYFSSARDQQGFGTAHLSDDEYDDFVEFMNRAANVIKGHGMIPRAFNDPFYSDGHHDAAYDPDYQIYFWGMGWDGMDNATPALIHEKGHDVINANSAYYYICCGKVNAGTYYDTPEEIEAHPFTIKNFSGVGDVDFEPAGAAFLIWCDLCDGNGHTRDILQNGMAALEAWADCLDSDGTTGGGTATGTPVPDKATITEDGFTVTGDGLTDITVADVTTSMGGYISSQMTGEYKVYSLETTTSHGDASASYSVSIALPSGWTNVKGYEVGSPAARGVSLPVSELNGSVNGSNYVFTTSNSAGTYVIENVADDSSVSIPVTLNIGDEYDFDGAVINGDLSSLESGEYNGLFLIDATVNAGETAGFIDAPTANTAYLISDGNNHYLTVSNGALASTEDPSAAAKWTYNVVDGGITFSNGTNYLTVDENGALALTNNPSGETTGSGTTGGGTTGGTDINNGDIVEFQLWINGGNVPVITYPAGTLVHYNGQVYKSNAENNNYQVPTNLINSGHWSLVGPYVPSDGETTDPSEPTEAPAEPLTAYWTYNDGYYITRNSTNYYLDYSNGWTASAGTAAAKGAPYKTGTATTSTLKLTAQKAGTYDLTVDGTTYKITILSPLSSGTCSHGISAAGYGVNAVQCAAATVSAITGYEEIVAAEDIYAHTLTPQIVENDVTTVYPTSVTVKVPLTDATGLASWAAAGRIIKAYYVSGESTVVVDATVTSENDVTYVSYTTPGGTVTSGLFMLPANYYTNEVSYSIGDQNDTKEVTIPGAFDNGDIYFVANEGETAADAKARVEALFGTSVEVTTEYSPYEDPKYVEAAETGKKFFVTDNNGHYLKYDEAATNNNGTTTKLGYTDNVEEATLFTATVHNTYVVLLCKNAAGGDQQLIYGTDTNKLFTIGATAAEYYSPSNDVANGIHKNNAYLYFDGDSWETGDSSASGKAVLYSDAVPETPAESTITFTGVAAGTGSVIIGTTRYNITVKDQELINSRLVIPYMITNNVVNTSSDPNKTEYPYFFELYAMPDVYPGITSEEGINLRDLIPETGYRNNDKMQLMRLTWLPNGSRQKNVDTDKITIAGDTSWSMFNAASRVEFERIRWNTTDKRWEFYLDLELDKWYSGKPWGPVITDENGQPVLDDFGEELHATEGWYPVNPSEEDVKALFMRANSTTGYVNHGTGQVVAYYIQPTDITKEVETSVVDWGPMIAHGDATTYGGEYVLLDFAVRYEDNTRNPSETGTFPLYTKTMTFHCKDKEPDVSDDGLTRTVNGILASGAPHGYEIYMITLTDSSSTTPLSTANSAGNVRLNDKGEAVGNGYDYDIKTEKAVWLKDENTSYDTTNIGQHADLTYGTKTNGEPYVAKINIKEQHAVLVTYYVRYVGESEDALRVHYIDQSRGDSEFYQYAIQVKTGTLFDDDFGRKDETGFDLVNNSVENYLGVPQSVMGNPADVSGMPSFYRTVDLDLVKVVRSEDGKDVYLYYNISADSKSIVVDFGVPVEINGTAVGQQLNTGDYLYPMNARPYSSGSGYLRVLGKYGDFIVTGSVDDSGKITVSGKTFYIPTDVMRGVDSAMIDVMGADGDLTGSHILNVYPATTVFYEESFATFTGTWSKNIDLPSVDRYNIASSNNIYQQTANPGMSGANNYGYDDLYARNLSNDNPNIAAAAGSYTSTVDPSAIATFEFTGDGVEVYANCKSDTGSVMVVLYKVTKDPVTGKNTEEKVKRIFIVDTHREDGGKDATKNQAEGDSINTPIVSVRGLEHGDYMVKIALTNVTNVGNGFLFDGFRVFNTMANTIDDSVYSEDYEAKPEYVEIRNSLVCVQLPEIDDTINSGLYADQIAADVASQVYELENGRNVKAVLMKQKTENGTSSNVDVLSSSVIKDYLENGPKNEVYIKSGETLTITLPGKDTAANTQVGLKTLTGTTTLQVSDNISTDVSQTNMYFKANVIGDVSSDNGKSTIIIVNNTGTVLSVTDLKIPGGLPEATSTDTQTYRARTFATTLRMMGYRPAPAAPVVKNGLITDEDGQIRYYVDGEATYAGVVKDDDGNIYYINSTKKAVKNCTYGIGAGKTNGIIEAGIYKFDEDGKLVVSDENDSSEKNGLVLDADGELRYYVNGVATYAGVVKDDDGNIYYINSTKKAVKNCTYGIGAGKTNGIIEAGLYKFDAEGKLIKN